MQEYRRCLIDLDIEGIVRVWKATNMPMPEDRGDVLACLHMARTASRSVPLTMRSYSHRWLLDHGLPSQLPDHLKSRAERLYPQTTHAVGISVNSKYPVVQKAISGVMREAVLEAYADGHQDEPEKVKQRMQEARFRERKGLGL